EIENLDRDLSRTKERLNDTDHKVELASAAAKAADQKAQGAQTAADGAQQAADNAKTFAGQGLDRLGKTVDGLNKFNMAKSETVLFAVNRDTLSPEARQQLEDLAKQASSLDRYIIEVQGFADSTGSASFNDVLSQRRAESVARFLAN